MSRHRKPIPSYRKHKQSGQAVVTVRTPDGGRKDVLLGRYGTPESQAEYRRVLAEAEAGTLGATRPGGDATVNELIVPFFEFAAGYYPPKTLDGYKDALGRLRRLYGHTPAKEFGPLALKAYRQTLIAAGLARTTVNKRTAQVKRWAKWCVGEELLPAVVLHGLQAVEGLRAGRSAAKETEPVRPPEPGAVDAALPHLPPVLRALAELQLLTAARPGELVGLRPADIDRSGPVWVVRLAKHKLTHAGKARTLHIGPKAQAVLAPLLLRAGDGCIFAPGRAESDRHRERGENRQTPRWPSHLKRNQRKRKGREYREHYTVGGYRLAVERACEKVGVPVWTPNQLRHQAATELRKRYGLEAAQVLLGHAKADTTQIYAERDAALAARVAAEVG